MKPGDVLLAPLPQLDGRLKDRPVLLLCMAPPFGFSMKLLVTGSRGFGGRGFCPSWRHAAAMRAMPGAGKPEARAEGIRFGVQ